MVRVRVDRRENSLQYLALPDRRENSTRLLKIVEVENYDQE